MNSLQPDCLKQNQERTITKQLLVEENIFLNKMPILKDIPAFEDSKEKLPQPLWEEHEDYIACYWKAWQLAFRSLRKPKPDTGFISNYIDTCFDDWLFMWDSCFILMFGKYADRVFCFQDTLDNFYSHQFDDGFICRQIQEATGRNRFTRHDPSATGPEVMAWCEWEYFLNFGNKERLREIFPPLMAYHRWMAEHHTWPDGSYFSTGWGCGMDNLPRHMPGYDVRFSHGHMIWVDACMQEYLNCNILLAMADILGRSEFVAELKEERDRLFEIINDKLWDEETGFYYDLWKTGEHNHVRHIGAFWALLAHCAPMERADRIIEYLKRKDEFCTEHRVPALSRSHPCYDRTSGYWRGGVWAPTNYMVMKGLDRYGKYDLSHEIALQHLYAVVEVFKDKGTLFENYAPEYIRNGKPSNGSERGDFVGWTGLPPIAVLFEFVFGIKPEADKGMIEWHVNLLEKHGVEKYPFGTDGELSLICEERKDVQEKPNITVRSNVPVLIRVIWGKDCHKMSYDIQV